MMNSFILSSSSFDRFLSSVIVIRCTSGDNSQTNMCTVEKSKFLNSKSDIQGSAINIKQNSSKAAISFCTFINCSSTACGVSSQRPDNYATGGACFVDVNEIEMKSCFFMSCAGTHLGSAVYYCVPRYKNAAVSCLCDICCGFNTTNIHSIYAFERGSSKIRDINSTNAISKSHYGYLHMGRGPAGFSIKYISIVKNYNDSIFIPLGISLLDETCYGYACHAYFANGTNQNGLISIWSGNYILNDTVFDNCYGNIYKVMSDFGSITFKNSVFCPSVILLSSITLESCKTEQTETFLPIKCLFKGFDICTKCYTKQRMPLSLATIVLILSY